MRFKSLIPDRPNPPRHSERPARLYQRVAVVSSYSGEYVDALSIWTGGVLRHPDAYDMVWASVYEPRG